MGNSPSRGTQVARQQARTRAARTGEPVAAVPSTSPRVQRKAAQAAQAEDYTRPASREQEQAVLRQAKAWGTQRYLREGQMEHGIAIEAGGKAFGAEAVGRRAWRVNGRSVSEDAYRAVVVAQARGERQRDKAEELLLLELPGAVTIKEAGARRVEMVHTHPGWGGSLSDMDVRNAMGQGWAAIHAVGEGPDGKPWLYTMRPGPKASRSGMWSWDSTYKKFKVGTTRQRIEKEVNAEMTTRVHRGQMTPRQVDNAFWHEVWTRVVREVGPDVLQYEARPLASAATQARRQAGAAPKATASRAATATRTRMPYATWKQTYEGLQANVRAAGGVGTMAGRTARDQRAAFAEAHIQHYRRFNREAAAQSVVE